MPVSRAADRVAGTGKRKRDSAALCDFQLEAVDPELFPTATWRRLMMRRMQSSDFNLSKVGDPRGALNLRRAIARFLGASRGMTVDPDQILIVSSIQQATNVIGQMFVTPGSPVIVERPGCSLIAPIYARAGAEIIPWQRMATAARRSLARPGRALIAVTPERQFPMGATMSTARRKALLDWAERRDAHVFEVDFDSEFRYEGSPKPALQSLDRNGRFIYTASFALTIGPGLRIGFLVLPPNLVDRALEALRLLDHAYPCQTQGAPWLDQAVLCDFLESGGYEKHLRRLRKTYMARRDTLVQALERAFGDCALTGTTSGTHLIWRLPDHLPDADLPGAGPLGRRRCQHHEARNRDRAGRFPTGIATCFWATPICPSASSKRPSAKKNRKNRDRIMKLVIGLDGHGSGDHALAFAKDLAAHMSDCELIVVYVIEWSPFSFQTPEENAERHKRREEEISIAMERVVTPAVQSLKEAGLAARAIVRHGDVADTIDRIAHAEGASQIIVARSSSGGLTSRLFGSSTANLVMNARVPVTVVA
jgi:DNA-binding transcriptional MocR family regulator/nucleotide-binding universal stress UspA family protein